MAKGLVVVDLPQELAGAITFWRLSGTTDRDALRKAWEDAGLDVGILPRETSEDVALHRAVDSLRAKHRLARKLQSVWAIVEERVNGDEDPDYSVGVRVGLDNKGGLIIDPPNHHLGREVKREFQAALDAWSSAEMSQWLTGLAATLRAVPLRDKGGVYFIARDYAQTWSQMAKAIRSASAHHINMVPAMDAEDTVEAVLDAVTAEAESEATTLENEMINGELGARALAGRVDNCESILSKIEFYEQRMDAKLPKLREKIEGLRASLAAAAFRAAAEQDTEADEQRKRSKAK